MSKKNDINKQELQASSVQNHDQDTLAISLDREGYFIPGEPLGNGVHHEIHQVPGCELLSVLGTGGMGKVYLARQKKLDRLVAVKVLQPKHASKPHFFDSLNQEALTMGALSHPNVVGCHDVHKDEEGIFIIMEYVPGRLSGRELVLRLGPLPEELVVEILLQAVRGLAYVHSKGFIHRDLKPDNLLFFRDSRQAPRTFEEVFNEPDYRVMICDFGIAEGIHKIADNSSPVLFGSPAFMAPEQAFTPEKVDFRADIYALAASAYYFLCGEPPFEGYSRDDRLLMKAEEDIPEPQLANGKKISSEFAKVLRKMGAADPDERYSDYNSLKEDLEYLSLFYAEKQRKLPIRLLHRRRSFLLGLAIGIVILAIGAGALYLGKYLKIIRELNLVSRTLTMFFWEGEREDWRIFIKDAGSENPSLFGSVGAGPIALRENLLPQQSIKFSVRLHGIQNTSIFLTDENGTDEVVFTYCRLVDNKNLSVRMKAENENAFLGSINLTDPMAWTDVKITVLNNQVWFYVNGELRAFRHFGKNIQHWRFQFNNVASSYIQIRDFFVLDEKNK